MLVLLSDTQALRQIGPGPARALPYVWVRRDMFELRQRDVGGRAHRTGTGRRAAGADDGASRPVMPALRWSLAACGGLEQDAALFAAVGRRRRKAARHRRQAPLLNVCLDEHKAHLAEVDVHRAWPVGADAWKQILRLEAVCDIVQLPAVAGEKYRAGARPVADADDVALHKRRPVWRRREGLVVSSMASRDICDGVLVPA